MIKLYGYKKCSTCRKAEKLLEKIGQEFEFIDITTTPPGPSQLQKFQSQSQLDWKKLFNTSGQVYRQLELKDKIGKLSVQEMKNLLASNGKLIKRPILTDGTNTVIGFNEEAIKKSFK